MALIEGEHFSVICPEADLNSVVVWRKDGIILKPGIKTVYSLFDYDNENHVHVDPFLTLYFVKVTKNEKGNYTCYVDNQKMLQLRIFIDSNAPIFTEGIFFL